MNIFIVFACLIFMPIKFVVVVTWNFHMIKAFLNIKQEILEINSPINFFDKKNLKILYKKS
jgi:hypothetical protein